MLSHHLSNLCLHHLMARNRLAELDSLIGIANSSINGRTGNAPMRELLMERVFVSEHEQKSHGASARRLRFHVRAPSSFERAPLPSGAQCHLYDCAGGSKPIEAADLGPLLERCSMLT